jgi:predicted AAA+ superfamily ATPase
MLSRKYNHIIEKYLSYFPVVGIIGPRQVGKTTIVKELQKTIQKKSIYLDLELTSDLNKLREPELYFREHTSELIILDEVQRMPSLFPLLRALIDQYNVPGRFIILGSASPELIRNSSESLAGRIIYQHIMPLDVIETQETIDIQTLWLRGGFPKALLAPDNTLCFDWLSGFIKTYIERDLPLLGLRIEPLLMERFWTMISQLNAQIINFSLLSKSLELSAPTLKRYTDFFESAFLIFRLQPYHQNISKRLIKSPKIYFCDSGLLHHFISTNSLENLINSIYCGNSWESFCINQIRSSLPKDIKIYYYRTREGSECDLVFEKAGKVEYSAEIKYSNSPVLSKGNYIAWDDLKSPINYIITPGSDDYPFSDNVRICSISTFINKYLI